MTASVQRLVIAIAAGFLLFLLYLKLNLATNMNLFGDEAFYWLESTRPAISYSDLPPVTAWLIGLGTDLFGDSYLAVRSLFLLLGTFLPLAIYFLAREFVSKRESMAAAVLSLCLPLVAIQGLLALPDVPLNLIALLLMIAATKACSGQTTRWWLVFGACAALGLATHFRMVVPLAAIAGYLLVSNRRQLRCPGPWLAAGIAALGLLPTLIFNLQHNFASLRFQFSDRHPWSFQSEGLLQPLQQALVSTPLLYALLIAAAVEVIRRARAFGGHWSLLAWAGLFPPIFYFVAGLFTDQVRVSFHWPLIGYLPLCVLLPAVLGKLLQNLGSRWPLAWAYPGVVAVPGLGIVAGLGLMIYLSLAVQSDDFHAPNARAYPDNMVGWSEAAALVAEIRDSGVGYGHLLADNFMLAAELSYELGGVPVFSLDHPLNRKHGRAAQLAIWELDENAWVKAGTNDTLLVIEVSAVEAADHTAWLHRSCDLMGGWRLERQLQLDAGRKRFLFLKQDWQNAGRCDFPAVSYLDQPAADAVLSAEFLVSGWAFEDNEGIAAVEVQIDGVTAGMARYGLPRPGVNAFFPRSTDPQHPAVGFELMLDSRLYPNGRHELRLMLLANDGGLHPSPLMVVYFKN